MRFFKLMRSARNGLWFVPVMCVLGGVALSFGTITVDHVFDKGLIPQSLTGDHDAALAILSTIAASMVSLTALVLTVTMVVVQLAMGQFSPRIVQTILRDKPSQMAIGIFVATFAHAMLAMREVSSSGNGSVPGLAIVVAFVLVLISIAVLVLYVNHIGQSLRVASLIELVGRDTRKLLNEVYPEDGSPVVEAGPRTITASYSGVVSHLNRSKLVEVAEKADCTLKMVPALGEFVPNGAPLFEVSGSPQDLDDHAVTSKVVLSLERTLDQDMAYGLRLLVDIAERSLSDSPFQDPTTAVQALDRLHDCLRQLAPRPFPDGRHRDSDGTVRLIVPSMDWDAYVHLAFDEIRMAGAGSPQVARRMQAALADLMIVAPPDRRPVLLDQLSRLNSLSTKTTLDERDVRLSSEPDRLGIGVQVGTDGA